MKAFIRAFCLALVTVGMLGLVGCGTDNETDAEKLSKKAGDPGAPATPKAEVFTPAKTQQEHFQRTQEDQAKYKAEMQKQKK